MTEARDARLSIAACPGSPACANSTVSLRDDAPHLAPLAQELGRGLVGLHISGCSKGCARGAATKAVLVGRDGRYDLVLDGVAGDHPVLTNLTLRDAKAALARIVEERHAQHARAERWSTTVHEPTLRLYPRRRGNLRRSFAIIRAEADLRRFSADEERVAVRIIHACGIVESARDIVCRPARSRRPRGTPGRRADPLRFEDGGGWRDAFAAAGKAMTSSARSTIRACRDRRRSIGKTRTAAAMELWRPHLAGALVAVGNAPTALFRLLEMLDAGAPRPAAVIGMPVGFVGAAESKRR